MKFLKKTQWAALSMLLFACQNQAEVPKTEDLNNFQFLEITIPELQEGYKNGGWTIRDVIAAYSNRIDAIDHSGPQLHSVIVVNPDALAIADSLDRVAPEQRGPLHGVPVLLKDNIDTKDQMATTAGSRALAGSMPLQDSEVAAQLRAAGAVILGKANLSEWANFRGQMSSSGWSGINGQTKNPYVLTRTPCGSSAGSGVSVSANLTLLAIGTETNGSIVCPSTANGIVGIKPTVGLISRAGIIPISYTQD
ncbi:amidase family protein, partial [bacterium]|nr:amidase family protein [bacterium]